MAWRAASWEHPRVLRTPPSRGEILSLQTWHGPDPVRPRNPSALGCTGWGFPRKCQNSPGLPGDSCDTQLAGGGDSSSACSRGCPAWSELGGLILPCSPLTSAPRGARTPTCPPPCPRGCQDRFGTKRHSHSPQPPQWCPPPCPQATTRRTSATRVPPRAQRGQEELSQPRAPRVSPPHLCSPKQGTPPAPHKASPPPHHRHPGVRGHPRQGAAPAPSPPGAVIPTQGAPSTAVTSCPVPCRADGSAEQTQTAGGVRVEPRRGAGCCTHSPPVPQAAPPPSARNRGQERGGRVAHVGPLGSSSLSLHVARDNGSL